MSIAGWIDYKQDLKAEHDVNQMFKTLNYIKEGEITSWISKNAAVAYNSTINKEGVLVTEGITEETTVTITYSGSINNIKELKNELDLLGYKSKNDQGARVLIQAYLCWGKEFVKKLLGSFALVVWDQGKGSLLLCRDRIGIKPMYYTKLSTGILFGSQPKSIIVNKLFKPVIEAKALQILLQPRLTLPGETPLKNLFEVPPAHILEFRDRETTLNAYWSLESKEHTDSFEESAKRVRDLLEEIIAGEMRSDRQLGAMLSGGLDSTSVVALLKNLIKKNESSKLNTYCLDFNKSENFVASELRPNVDTPYALEASNYIGTNHKTISFSVDDLIVAIPATREARDLPAWGQFDASMYNLFSEMKKECNLAFSGEGADEFFGGYPYLFSTDLTSGDTFPWLGESLRLSEFLSPEVKAYFDPQKDELERYNYLLSQVPRLPGEDPENARMREVIYLGMSGPLQVILDRKDKMSSALGLDMRIPFCDHRLVQYVWNIPWEMKTTGGLKGLLKKAVEDILPESTLKRKKSAYPHNQDKIYESGLIRDAKQILDNQNSSIREIFDVKRLKEFISKIETNNLSASDFPGGSSPAYMLVHVIELDNWMKNYNVKFNKK